LLSLFYFVFTPNLFLRVNTRHLNPHNYERL
jgi:hypothetical protein